MAELGVPATEVARRARHGVVVLPKIYAHCIDGQADAANKRITDALGPQGTQPEPGDETLSLTHSVRSGRGSPAGASCPREVTGKVRRIGPVLEPHRTPPPATARPGPASPMRAAMRLARGRTIRWCAAPSGG
jgi:hypothetical protein